MTRINWNSYVDDEREFEERAAKHEGEFAIVSVGPVGGEEFYKLHIGLYNGEILRDDGVGLTDRFLTDEDLGALTDAVGQPF